MYNFQRILLKVLKMAEDIFKSVVVIALSFYVLQTCQQSFKQHQALRKEDPRNPSLSEKAFRELIDPVNVHKCTAQPDILYRICCVFPPFFTRDVAKECGGIVMAEFFDEKNNVSAFHRINFDCTHWYCVLDKYGILDDQGGFSLDKYYSHLDLWVSLNPMFADAVLEAKVFCKDEFRPEFPLHTCQFSNFQGCIRNYIQVECPIYIPSPECNEKKEFLKDCKQFFHRRK